MKRTPISKPFGFGRPMFKPARPFLERRIQHHGQGNRVIRTTIFEFPFAYRQIQSILKLRIYPEK